MNISELLKDCPTGMELDCTMYEDCKFLDIDSTSNSYLIRITTPCGIKYLDKYGCYTTHDKAKCIIFPKGKTTWEGFVPPCKFKDGDVVVCLGDNEEDKEEATQIFILKSQTNENRGFCYTGYDFKRNKFFDAGNWNIERLATEEEKQKFFKAIKANGYKWNPETKTLEKLIEPKFKVGDKIVKRNSIGNSWIISSVSSECYGLQLPKGSENIGVLPVCKQDDWELAPNKFNIADLKAFESRVLVRTTDDDIWRPAIYGFTDSDRYYVVGGIYWKQCVPYEVNKELLGTTNNPKEYGSE